MKRLLTLGVLCALLATGASAERAGSYGATNPPPAPGSPRFVQIESIEGLPRNGEERLAVLGALRSAFATDAFATEARDATLDTWRDDGALPNRFRLLEGDPSDSVWTLRLVFGFPRELPASKLAPRSSTEGPARTARRAGTRAARGFTLFTSARSPESRFRNAPADERRFEVVLPADTTDAYPWFAAGQAAGVLVLESLHRATGDLREGQRASVAPARRARN